MYLADLHATASLSHLMLASLSATRKKRLVSICRTALALLNGAKPVPPLACYHHDESDGSVKKRLQEIVTKGTAT